MAIINRCGRCGQVKESGNVTPCPFPDGEHHWLPFQGSLANEMCAEFDPNNLEHQFLMAVLFGELSSTGAINLTAKDCRTIFAWFQKKGVV